MHLSDTPPDVLEILETLGSREGESDHFHLTLARCIATVLREHRSFTQSERDELVDFLGTFQDPYPGEHFIDLMRKDAMLHCLNRIREEEFVSQGPEPFPFIAKALTATRKILRAVFARIGMETPGVHVRYKDVQREREYAVIYHLEDIARGFEETKTKACTVLEDAVQ
jgi:hypothetical protein